MRKIISASYLDYLFLFGGSRSTYTDLSVKSALAAKGICYILLENDEPFGYLCAAEENGITYVLYAMTMPKNRHMHVFTELLAYTVSKSAFPVRIHILETHVCYEAVVHVCRKLGFLETSSCMIFSGKSKDFYRWEAYMKQNGETLCGLLCRQGYNCISFEDAEEELIKQLVCQENGEFYQWLDVQSFFENKEKHMDKKMSFLAVKEGKAAAYTLVRRPDEKSTVFEHIAAARSYVGSGVILLPFAKSMEMFHKFGCRRCVYAMYEDNFPANAFQRKLLWTVTSEKKRSHNFIYQKGESQNDGT